MIKRLVILVTMLFSVSSLAIGSSWVNEMIVNLVAKTASPEVLGLNWTVGDKASYKIDMGFIQGKMQSFVREEVEAGIWMQQDMDLGFMGKQKVEVLFDKNTGQVLEIIANGQKQDLPDSSNMELEDMKEANITVSAGTFDCVYMKVRDKNKNESSEAWINPQLVPMSGLIKQISPSPFGQVKMELTSFEFNR